MENFFDDMVLAVRVALVFLGGNGVFLVLSGGWFLLIKWVALNAALLLLLGLWMEWDIRKRGGK